MRKMEHIVAKSDADILEEARIYLEVNGWWKGRILGPNGRQVCGLGALIYSQGWAETSTYGYFSPGTAQAHKEDVERILGKVTAVLVKDHPNMREGGSSDFVTWNDHIAKSKQEVLDAFAKAEKIERAGFDPDA